MKLRCGKKWCFTV